MRAAALLLLGLCGAATAQEPPAWAEIGALFADRCVKCHSGFDAPMGLSLDSYASALSGSWIGKVLIAGDAVTSPLLRRLRGQDTPRMPLDGPPFLAPEEIARVEAWVLAGLPEGEAAPPPAVAERSRPAPGEPVTFADVEPIFLKACIKCHSDNSRMEAPPEGLRLIDYQAILQGGERLVLVPGNAEASELWRRVAGVATPRMPFDGPPWLPDEDIRLIRDWIAQGAPDAGGTPASIPAGREIRLRGTLTEPDAIDGARFAITAATRIDKSPRVGAEAELRGVIQPDGTIRATRLRAR
jgi:mono/diheme cytochrome c family protein